MYYINLMYTIEYVTVPCKNDGAIRHGCCPG